MSETPYDAPADDVAPPPPPNARPRSLTVIAAMAAALGLMGLFGVVYGCASTGLSLASSSAFTMGMPPEQAAAQSALMAASRPFMFVGLALFLAIIPLAVGLALGGLQVLMDKASGAGWLENAFLFGLVVEPVRVLLGIVQIVVLWDDLMLVAAASAGQPGLPAGFDDTMSIIVMVSTVLGQAVALAWAAAKMTLYAYGRRVLGSEGVQDWLIART